MIDEAPMEWKNRPSRYEVFATSISAALLTLVSLWGCYVTAGDGRWGLMVLAGCGTVLGLVMGRLAHVLALQRRFPEGLEEPHTVLLDGEPATFIPRWDRVDPVAAALTLILGLGTLVGAALLGVGGHPGWGSVIGVVGIWFLTHVLWIATGRWTSGGIWITPTRLEQRWTTAWWSVKWDDIVKDVHHLGGIGIVATDWEQRHLAPTFRNRTAIPRHSRRGKEANLVLGAGGTALQPFEFVMLIGDYLKDPAARREAGSDRFQERIAELRERNRQVTAYLNLSPEARREADQTRKEKFRRFVAEMEARFAAEAAEAVEAETRKDVTSSGPE